MIALALAVGPAAAEHTIETRYVVLGFVKDARGKLVAGQRVEIVRDKTGLKYRVDSDEQGFFVVFMRLGNESVGETLTVRSGGATITVTVRFDAANHTDDRGTRVDLDHTRFIERPAAFLPTLVRFVRDERS